MDNAQSKNNIGYITVKTGARLVRIFIQKQGALFIAAAKVKGTIWYETSPTGLSALLSLADRLKTAHQW